MTRGLQQQDPMRGFVVPKQAPAPQHGQKAALKPTPEPRSFQPRTAH
jgi:hypothetical protein